MMNSPDTNLERFKYLFGRYLDGLTNKDEEEELAGLEKNMDDQFVDSLLKESWESSAPHSPVFSVDESRHLLYKILGLEKRTRVNFHSSRNLLVKFAAAAMLVLTIGAAAFYFFKVESNRTQQMAEEEVLPSGDINPGSNKAYLTLADGQLIVLDSIADGIVIIQEGTRVVKSGDGSLEYMAGDQSGDAMVYNTINTPVGGQYQLSLSDGTKVWLNAASSMRYPVEFKGKERRVFITGEVYFEVNPATVAETGVTKHKGTGIPFIVDIDNGKGIVEVLGTDFNINAYPDEDALKTTLLEGAIKFTPAFASGTPGNSKSVALLPGQQAIVTREGEVSVSSDADMEQIIAWTKGYFQFSSSSLEEVMKQIARWYDVEVIFEGKVSARSFGGKIQRDLNLSEVLNILRRNQVEFRIEGRTLYVKS